MRIHPWNILLFTGMIWLTAGFMLTLKGLNHLVYAMPTANFKWFNSPDQGTLFLICFSLLMGFVKGRYIMIKTARRVMQHLLSQKAPLKVSDLYPKSYYFILISMMSLGILFKFLAISKVILGVIDLTIGSALAQGSMHYFKFFQQVKAEKLSQK